METLMPPNICHQYADLIVKDGQTLLAIDVVTDLSWFDPKNPPRIATRRNDSNLSKEARAMCSGCLRINFADVNTSPTGHFNKGEIKACAITNKAKNQLAWDPNGCYVAVVNNGGRGTSGAILGSSMDYLATSGSGDSNNVYCEDLPPDWNYNSSLAKPVEKKSPVKKQGRRWSLLGGKE